ncbi:MAG TPA: MarR family winged helix-turn-helix transcriptional regulator [Usitatibacter sp.]|nr:MarR family winged helix-turn-helix transcriptional regulator [Usitatibacter sp.]
MLKERFVLDNCACGKVRMAARAVTRRYDEALRPVGLRATQFAVLIAIGVGEAASITALAKRLGMDRSTLTRNLGPLVDEGLIAVGAESWRRSRNLELTKKGRTRMQQALPYWESAQQSLKETLGNRHWDTAHAGLDQLIRAA